MSEVRAHASPDSLWIVANGLVYDLTKFVNAHPGGAEIILNAAGKDATHIFNAVHPSDLPEKLLGPDCVVGKIDKSTIQASDIVPPPPKPEKKKTQTKLRTRRRRCLR